MNWIAKIERKKNRQLHKFGGSSLANIESYLRVVGIIKEYSQPDDMIVVSASGKTTDQLISWTKFSQIDRFSAYQIQEALYRYHSALIFGLLSTKIAMSLVNSFTNDLKYLTNLLNQNMTDEIYAEVVGHGEVWSARLMAAVLEQQGLEAVWLDARDFLRAERSVLPKINERLSYSLLKNLLLRYSNKRIVITGFISRSSRGKTVLLGRNGSDYSATQIGALARVSRVTIWSDVAGIYSADPRKVKDAHLLPMLHLDEASELARLASPVLHIRTLQPVFDRNIDLQFRCSYSPKQGATRIQCTLFSSGGARIITSHDDISLIQFQVSSCKEFKLLQKDIELILIRAQLRPLAIGIHSDRQLLQFCYTSELAGSVLKILNEAGISGKLRQGLALVALIGLGVARNPLHRYRFWQHLQGYPVEFIWQSKEGISLVAVLRNGPTKSLIQGLHTALFHAKRFIGVVFPFLVGDTISYFLKLFLHLKVISSTYLTCNYILLARF